ncbi:MAG: hypothetical protein K5849_03530 [Bacteroidales bacterium]|nr:hypothetical protein [Bacteroidales bacterium]
MKNPFLTVSRWFALRRNQSTVATTLLPLREVHSATVFVDTTVAGEDPARISRAIRQFFDYHGIPVLVLCPQQQDINLVGILKPRLRGSKENPRREDLFISLAASPENFAAEYEARCSTARFKVGRFQLPGGVYDLVVATPETSEAGQAAAFAAIKDYLDKIQ